MSDAQLETLQMMANTLTGWADMYGGPHSYYCYRNLLDQGYVEKLPGRKDWVRIIEKGRVAVKEMEEANES